MYESAHDQIVHGKGLYKDPRLFLGLDEEQIERLVFLSMDILACVIASRQQNRLKCTAGSNEPSG